MLYRINARKVWWAANVLITEQPDTAPRTTGSVAGIDCGLSSALLATSAGRLLGAAMLARLHELDAVLAPLAADLQRRGAALKTGPAYRRLQQPISEFVANEIGCMFNGLPDTDIRDLVVQRLDFRGGGLSKRVNRLCGRGGRRVRTARLARLSGRRGITLTAVPAPYSSQQCRADSADVNACRVVASRHCRPLPGGTGPRSPENTRRLLDSDHRQHQARSTALQVPVDAAPQRLRDLKP